MDQPELSRLRGSSLKAAVVLCIAWSASFVNPALAQTSVGPPTEDRPPSQRTTLETTVRRVSVEVVVTDWKGHVVTGLTQEDFSIEEDNVPQPIRTFDVHSDAVDSSYTSAEVPLLPPNTFLNVPKTLESGTPTVILYDAINTSFEQQAYGEQQILKFLKLRRPGSSTAIFVLSDGLHLLQGFTEQLSVSEAKKAIEHFAGAGRWNRPRSLDRRVAVTLKALTGIGRFLASMPGRKNLIWYSSGFPESILPGSSMAPAGGVPPIGSGMFAPPNYSEPIRQATDLLNLSHVAVYPVDVRGVRVDPTYSAERNGGTGINPQVLLASRLGFINLENAVRSTMDTLADDTGGHAFYGTNDLAGAAAQAVLSGSTYYSLTYAPTNPKYDGRLRHIKVTLDKPGYTLAYRKTYFADDLNAAARAAADAPESPLLPSLERGTPLLYGLFVEAHLDPTGPPVAATPAQMQVLAKYEVMQAKVGKEKKPSGQTAPTMMQSYVVSYGLTARQLDMATAGAHQASLEFGMIAYDDDGRKLYGLDTRVDETVPGPQYAKLMTDGYHAVQTVAVPVTAASIRLAVRDIHSDRVGSLEVPLPLAKTEQAKPTGANPQAR